MSAATRAELDGPHWQSTQMGERTTALTSVATRLLSYGRTRGLAALDSSISFGSGAGVRTLNLAVNRSCGRLRNRAPIQALEQTQPILPVAPGLPLVRTNLWPRAPVAKVGLSIARKTRNESRIPDVIDPRFALTNQPPELAGDPDHEWSSPDTDGQKPTEERHRIDALAPLLGPVDVLEV